MNARETAVTSIDVLLVEDNPVDVLVTRRALGELGARIRLHVVENGEDAMDFLYQTCHSTDTDTPCPDLILLDMNLPRKNGKEVLAEIKQHPKTLHIPVVMLTTSDAAKDIWETYSLHANCYITKPIDVEQFSEAVQCLGGFWTKIAKLPSTR